MRVRDLGALMLVVDAREQPVVGTRGPAMLALLTIHVNERVSVDALMEAAWGDRITPGAASTLTSHIWRLRQALEPTRNRHTQSPSVLVNDSDGYRLIGGPSTVDSLLFAESAAEVRDLLAAGHAQRAVRRADAALALWRGTPYGAFAEADWAQPAVARLEELHGQLRERRIEGLLATGAVDAALSDLHPLIETLPFRESLRALQMEAQYLSGRGEQALESYREARRVLVEEVGIEPGPQLQEMHRRILSNDPTLAPPPSRVVVPTRATETHLPLALTPLVGRADVLKRLTSLLRDQRLVTLIGAAGCGKTRVAIAAARAAAESFPDGVWFVDLSPVSDPGLVVETVVSTIGFAGTAGATPMQDLRRYLLSRRVLLVLDNCEHVLDGVEHLVRATLGDAGETAEYAFLLTSREPVGIDGETIWSLDPLGLPAPDADDPATAPAVELFLQRLAAAAPTVRHDEDTIAHAVEICTALDGLPLPIELAAARALSHSLDDIAGQVAADPSRLSRVGRGPNDHRATVRSAIEWSHRLLGPAEQLAHRRLSLLPGTFTAGPATAVIGYGDTDEDADELLARLVRRSMLKSDGGRGPRRPTRFRQLATVRAHAGHALGDPDEHVASLDRRDAWVDSLVAAKPALWSRGQVEWCRAVDDDVATVSATLHRRLMDEPSVAGARLAHSLTYYWYRRERLAEALRWLQLGADVLAAEPEDSSATEALLIDVWLSAVQSLQRRPDVVQPRLATIRQRAAAASADRLVEVGEGLAALALAGYVGEDFALVRELSPLLTEVAGQAGDPGLALLADAVSCCALLVSGQLGEAVTLAGSVQERLAVTDNPMADWVSTAPLIVSALQAGRPADGIPWTERCLSWHVEVGTGSVGLFTETRANFAVQLGEYADAARIYGASRTATRRAGLVWPNQQRTHQLLAATRDHLTRTAYERAWQEGERLDVATLVPRRSPSPRTSAVG